MPRQATRSGTARGPLDKLRGPVRKMAEEVFSLDTDRAVLKDEPLMNGLSELQTKQVWLRVVGFMPPTSSADAEISGFRLCSGCSGRKCDPAVRVWVVVFDPSILKFAGRV